MFTLQQKPLQKRWKIKLFSLLTVLFKVIQPAGFNPLPVPVVAEFPVLPRSRHIPVQGKF